MTISLLQNMSGQITHSLILIFTFREALTDKASVFVCQWRCHNDATQVKLFPDIGPSDVHFWDDGDCQAGIEQLQLEDLGRKWVVFLQHLAFSHAENLPN